MKAIDFIKDHGVEKAREVVSSAPDGVTHYFNRDYGLMDLKDLEQAIADYEAIYSNDCEILDFPEDYTSPNCKKFDERVNSNETK